MALRTEAPSTGSQREPSRLEQNTNQRLTGHSHSPHQHGGRTPAQFAPPCSTFYFPQSRMDECFDFSCHPGEVGPGRDWQADNEGTFTWVCVCVCVCLRECDLATLYLAAVPLSPVPEYRRAQGRDVSVWLNLPFVLGRRENPPQKYFNTVKNLCWSLDCTLSLSGYS